MKAIFIPAVLFLLLISAFVQAQEIPLDPMAKDSAMDTTKKDQAKKDNTGKPPKKPCCCEDETSDCLTNAEAVGTTDILIDFKSKQLGKKKEWYAIKKGDFVRVKIMNYNPLQYKAIINSVDSSVTAPVDAKLFTSLFDPTGLSSIVSNLVEKAGIAPIPKDHDNKKYDKDMNGLTDEGLPKKCNPFVDICPVSIGDCPTKEIKVKEKRVNRRGVSYTVEKQITVTDTASCLKDYYEQVAAFIFLENHNLSSLKKDLDKVFYDALRKPSSIRSELYPDCNLFKNAVTKEIISSIESDFKKYNGIIGELIQRSNDNLKKYSVYLKGYQEFIAKNPELAASDALVKNFFTETMNTLKKVSDKMGYENLAALISKLEVLKLYSTCYTSLPIYLADDVKKINVELKALYDSLGLPSYNTTIILPLIQRKVWGASSGIFITGLKNENYNVSVTEVTLPGGAKDTSYNLVAEENDGMQIGAMGQAYIGWKSKESEKPNYWGFNFGAGLSIEAKPKPRVLLGASFITGEKNRFVISAGVLGGYVRRLSNAFNTTTPYTVEPKDVTRHVLKGSGFVSISFSFLSK